MAEEEKTIEQLKAEADAAQAKLKARTQQEIEEAQKKRAEDKAAARTEQEAQRRKRNEDRATEIIGNMQTWYNQQKDFFRRIGRVLTVEVDKEGNPIFKSTEASAGETSE